MLFVFIAALSGCLIFLWIHTLTRGNLPETEPWYSTGAKFLSFLCGLIALGAASDHEVHKVLKYVFLVSALLALWTSPEPKSQLHVALVIVSVLSGIFFVGGLIV